ncbi:tetratricopeptide repeat protein [Candidatus Omnitrophota bacterium]
MKARLIVLVCVLLTVFVQRAACDELNQAQALFYQGNSHYSEEKIEEAINDYKKALSFGYESGPLYYNLGNAYFKQGFLGKAVINYLRAQRLIPDDADLISNLRYAQSLVKGGIITPKRSWFLRMFFVLANRFSLDSITIVSMALCFVFSIVVVLLILLRNLRKACAYVGAAVLILLIISASLFCVQFYSTIIQKEAVVIVNGVDSKFEPLEDATTFFVLNEGESVNVIASKKGWLKIRRPDSKQGWVKESDIEFL